MLHGCGSFEVSGVPTWWRGTAVRSGVPSVLLAVSEQAVGQAEVDPGQLARGGQVLGGDVPLIHGHVPVVALQPGAALGRRGPSSGEDELDGSGGELAGLLEHREHPYVLLAAERLARLVP